MGIAPPRGQRSGDRRTIPRGPRFGAVARGHVPRVPESPLESPASRRETMSSERRSPAACVCVRTFCVSLPSSSAEMPRRPCDAITMRVALVLLRRCEDRFPGRGRDRIRRLAFDARRGGLGGDPGEDLLRVLGRELRVFPACYRFVDDAVGVGRHRVIGRGIECGQLRADGLREADRVGQTALSDSFEPSVATSRFLYISAPRVGDSHGDFPPSSSLSR